MADFDAVVVGAGCAGLAAAYKLASSGKEVLVVERGNFAGAEIIYGIRVDDLIIKDGKVCGIIAGEDQIEAEVTIIAEGVNSLLPQKLGFLRPPAPNQMAVGIKALYELPEQTVTDRFMCNANEGAAWLFIGEPTKGHVGGGFLYTNKQSISIGLVATLSDLVTAQTPVYQMLEDFVNHEAIAPVLRGGKLL